MPANESARYRVPLDIHQHEEPLTVSASARAAPGGGDDSADSPPASVPGRLRREGGRVLYQAADGDEPLAVRVVWARPLSDRGGPVSLLLADKNREVAYIPDLSRLDADSRRVAEEELALGLILPVIRVVHQVLQRFGNYYWDVETSMGRRQFLLSAPENNSYRIGDDSVVIRDVSGNCYEIASISSLDKASRREMDRVL